MCTINCLLNNELTRTLPAYCHVVVTLMKAVVGMSKMRLFIWPHLWPNLIMQI